MARVPSTSCNLPLPPQLPTTRTASVVFATGGLPPCGNGCFGGCRDSDRCRHLGERDGGGRSCTFSGEKRRLESAFVGRAEPLVQWLTAHREETALDTVARFVCPQGTLSCRAGGRTQTRDTLGSLASPAESFSGQRVALPLRAKCTSSTRVHCRLPYLASRVELF